MLHKSTFDFLKKLKKNNNRDWFARNKSLYEDAKRDFEVFVFELINIVAGFDPSCAGLQPSDCIFRIFRDVRFSKDKKPYKTNFGASINSGGKKVHVPGYYIHVEPGACIIAGGIYMPEPDQLFKVRAAIMNRYKDFKKIVEGKEFAANFKEIWGEKLKTAPKGFPKDHASSNYLKYKSYIVYRDVPDSAVLSNRIYGHSEKMFKLIKPLNDFLSSAISE